METKETENITLTKEKVMARVLPRLVNMVRVTEECSWVPFLDLAVIFYLEVGNRSFLITKELQKRLGLEVGKLYEIACKNVGKMLAPTFMSLEKLLEKLTDREYVSEGGLDFLFIISNKTRENGACVLLDKEFLTCIVLPLRYVPNPDELREMVLTVNATQLKLEDVLSNSVYKFDADTKEVVML